MKKNMNINKSLNTQNTMKNRPFDLRVSHRRGNKKLPKYGDYDLDGTMNYKDCNPYDPSRDGFFSDVGSALKKAVTGVGRGISSAYQETKEAFTPAAKEAKRFVKYEVYKPTKKFVKKEMKAIQKTPTYISAKEQVKQYVPYKNKPKMTSEDYYVKAEQVAERKKANAIAQEMIAKGKVAAEWDKQRKWEATKERARKFTELGSRKKRYFDAQGQGHVITTPSFADRITNQLAMPFSKTEKKPVINRKTGQQIFDKKTGLPVYKYVRTSPFKDYKSKGGGRTYAIGTATIHVAKRRLAKQRKTAYGTATGNPGRPRGSFKPRFIPGVGYRPIPAQQYYKILRRIKAHQEQQALATDIVQAQQLARRGIPPQQARVIVDQRQLQQLPTQQAYAPEPQPQMYEQQQVTPVQSPQIQQEMARIQQLQPFARKYAVMQLQRRIQMSQPIPQAPPRQEISLMTGKPVLAQPQFQRRERWSM